MKEKSQQHAITWRAPEYLYKKKTLLWYTNVSVFFFVVLFFLFALENWIGCVVLAVAFWIFLAKANDKPRVVDYTIDIQGIHIEERLIHFEEVASFTVEEAAGSTVIVLESSYPFTLPTTLVIKKTELDAIIDILLQHIPYEQNYSLFRHITHWLHY